MTNEIVLLFLGISLFIILIRVLSGIGVILNLVMTVGILYFIGLIFSILIYWIL